MKHLAGTRISVSTATAGLLAAALLGATPSWAGQSGPSEHRMAQGCVEHRPDNGARSDQRPECPTTASHMKHHDDKQDMRDDKQDMREGNQGNSGGGRP